MLTFRYYFGPLNLFLLNSELLAHQTPKITKTNVQILRNILLFRNTLTC
mgnify:CR=1 FL=1